LNSLDLAVIGNGSFSALLNREGRIGWSCLPRFDGDPTFCTLLDGGNSDRAFGFFDIALEGFERAEQRYLRNTAIVETTLYDGNGGAVEIVDFAPRFRQLDRTYRPVMIVRRIRPKTGAPRISIRLRPATDYGRKPAETTHGSNHIRYIIPDCPMRVTTDAPVSLVLEEVPFVLDRTHTLVFGPDETLASGVDNVGRDFLERTADYWKGWTRGLSLPFEWQDEVIRAAITLKLCAFEETGAVIAGLRAFLSPLELQR